MDYVATPFCMTEVYFREAMMAGACFDIPVGKETDYEFRETVSVSGNSVRKAASKIWEQFQNLSDDHQPPGGGRSLMVGDLILLQEPFGAKTHWLKIEGIGFSEVERPSVG